jgi:DNA-binding beta-propeller fold protein YncE
VQGLERLFRSATAVALLAGCSGGGSQPPTAKAPTSALTQLGMAPRDTNTHAPGPAQVIVSDSYANAVSVFDAKGHLQTRLTKGINGPLGLTTDSAANLYVANSQDSNVLVYSQPYKSVNLTLNEPGQYALDVAVDKAGMVGVMSATAPSGGGNVTFYKKGSTSACANVSDPNWNEVSFGAFDASGNLFVDGVDRDGNPLVGEVSGGCAATSIAMLSVGNTLSGVAGVQVVHGNILILNQNYASFAPEIYTYAPPSGSSLGSPIATTKLSAGIEMEGFAMTRDDRYLWIAHSGVANGRIKYTYPGGRFVKSFNEPGLVTPFGIAVNPAGSP